MSLELNSCVLIDYRLWAQKVKGGNGSNIASSSASSSASSIPLNLGVGCAPSCWPIFGFRNPPGCSQGAQRAVFCAVRVADFLAEGAGWGASPGRGGELGCQAQQVLKKNCEIGVGFSFAAHSEPFESQGARAAKRYVNGNLVEREKGDEFGIKLLRPD